MRTRNDCGNVDCGCSTKDQAGWGRREFLKAIGLGAGVLATQPWQAMAGPFTREDFDQLVPNDKKLQPDWVKSLTERGERTVYRGADLEKIGMPIGGICAGQLYLGGDGKLWHWDIFNQRISTGAEHYAKPLAASSLFEQGFGIQILGGAPSQFRPLDRAHWRDVAFIGEYPIGYVEYGDPDIPIRVSLEAFSPFIPLNTDDSSLPATVLAFTVRNDGATDLELGLSGWLENPICLYSSQNRPGLRHNRLSRGAGLLSLECSATEASASTTSETRSQQPFGPLSSEPDFGTLGLALLNPSRADFGSTSIDQPGDSSASPEGATKPFGQKLIGSITRKIKLAPNASAEAVFVLTWHMPNLRMSRLPPGRYYGVRFASASAVARYVAKNFKRLATQTRFWHDTWYDSTLPYWFLDRTFLNTSILATSTAHRFGDGRFYAWEGVGCCEGTCGHVWQYAHAVARLFPDLERMTREKVDFGSALQPDGAIHFRGEFNDFPAIDAQAGAILRALREHQMSVDGSFLKRSWPNIKRATQWLIRKDADGNGLIESNQHNTLDTDWFGPVAWLSGLYLAALLAAETMALELDDREFAAECRRIFNTGQKNLVQQLFDGQYFINKPDPAHLDAINSGTGCEIDQVFGQSWAFQIGLPRVFPKRETLSALKSLWRYNFTPDVGPYRKRYQAGRWYAMPGEAGLLMCTFPRADWDYAQAKGKGPDWAAGYFNECMNGFEYQAAGHMIWEGLIKEGLAVTRAVHDRYHASRRNPWNEVECGDHYARSMASYGVFLAACGFEYHGPNGHIGFAPRVVSRPQDSGVSVFKSAFTSAQGWGTFTQSSSLKSTSCKIALKYGDLRIQTISFEQNARPSAVRVRVAGQLVASEYSQTGNRVLVTLKKAVVLHPNESIDVRLG
jgi:non-lysosomal glucosylceramidase